MANVPGESNILPVNPQVGTDTNTAGVTGQSNTGPGVLGQSLGQGGSRPGGVSVEQLPGSDGVLGEGTNGVRGVSSTPYGKGPAPAGAGVWGANTAGGPGVYGVSTGGNGVQGVNGAGSGTMPAYGCGILGESDNGYGVYGASKTASGVYGTSGPNHFAGEFVGDVSVTGNLKTSGDITTKDVTASGNVTAADVILSGADCAEQFDASGVDAITPGTVLVIDDNGALRQSDKAYDRRVAGVVSGAGTFKPGIVLDRGGDGEHRTTVALVGKAYCKVDADFGSVAVGDLLTSSDTPGHAMKASDPMRGFGSVIGKALRPLESGRGLLPILVALQ